jgi:S-methylmethionine-dependent homocysteine/selenocysteine methylase
MPPLSPRAARSRAPRPGGPLHLTDGGLETTLVFLEGMELPCFAAIDMMRRPGGPEWLRGYYGRYIQIAKAAGAGFVLESPTWRASPDWAEPLGLDQPELDGLNRAAIALLHDIAARHADSATPMVVSGCIGPRGDGYKPGEVMSPEEARDYHLRQVKTFAEAGVDLVTAVTMTNIPEALGIVQGAKDCGVPVVVSFTVETNGRLPTGDALVDAIGGVDELTDGYPAYFMVNCAHPSHFGPALDSGATWLKRIGGLRANASRLSHAELDASTELDSGDPEAFGREHRELLDILPHLVVLGGCCGTDHRHVGAIAGACVNARVEPAAA